MVTGGGATATLPIHFSLSDNFLLLGKFASTSTKFGAGNPPFRGIFGSRLEHPSLLCRKITTSCSQFFLTHDAAVVEVWFSVEDAKDIMDLEEKYLGSSLLRATWVQRDVNLCNENYLSTATSFHGSRHEGGWRGLFAISRNN